MRQSQTQTSTQQIMQANDSWLYQRDASGQYARNYDGSLKVTPVGVAYIRNVEQLARAGVQDPRQADLIARQMLAANPPQAVVPPVSQAANATAAPNRNPVGAAPPLSRNRGAVTPTETTRGRSLADHLRDNFQREGLRESDFMNLSPAS
jgi:hypothetical protein